MERLYNFSVRPISRYYYYSMVRVMMIIIIIRFSLSLSLHTPYPMISSKQTDGEEDSGGDYSGGAAAVYLLCVYVIYGVYITAIKYLSRRPARRSSLHGAPATKVCLFGNDSGLDRLAAAAADAQRCRPNRLELFMCLFWCPGHTRFLYKIMSTDDYEILILLFFYI